MKSSALNVENIWKSYSKTKCPELKKELILKYTHIVKLVAGRLLIHIGQHVDYDDLISYGTFGLIDAVDKFDAKKGVKFETYASMRIRGAIIDNLRKMDWVPRTLRQKNKEYEQICVHLESELGREPTEAEIAEHLKISIEEARNLMKKSVILSLISLDDYLEQNYESEPLSPSTPEDTPEGFIDLQEIKKMLNESIDQLSEKEKMVVTLYYFEEMTFKEISKILQVSESGVSQMHSRAIARMQGRLGQHKSVLFS